MIDQIYSFDSRRELAIPGDHSSAIEFATDHWIRLAKDSMARHGKFCVAISGGSTPKEIFRSLSATASLDWAKIWVFWSDERAVHPTHSESNYLMAKETGLLAKVPPSQIFRMEAEHEIATHAKNYEALIRKYTGPSLFDLVMLGVGEDGHTASLFPYTEALGETERLVAANYVPVKKSWRMTLTFPCINQSRRSVVYALGASKQEIVKSILSDAHSLFWPASRVGTSQFKSLWVLDKESASLLFCAQHK